jgi:hypothetical protein
MNTLHIAWTYRRVIFTSLDYYYPLKAVHSHDTVMCWRQWHRALGSSPRNSWQMGYTDSNESTNYMQQLITGLLFVI